jgi:hypothetical protein
MMAAAPALYTQVSTNLIASKGSSKDLTYKTPKLIAIPTPIFSAGRICSFQRTFQGSKARDISISADHTMGSVSPRRYLGRNQFTHQLGNVRILQMGLCLYMYQV